MVYTALNAKRFIGKEGIMRKSIGAWTAGLAVMVAASWLPRSAGAEDAKPPIPAVESRIDRVLLYSDRALVIRAAKVELAAGRTKVAFEGLPGKLADYSVAAALTGPGGAQVANIEIEPVYKTSFRSKEAEDAAKELKDLEREMRALQDRYAAVQAEADFARTLHIGARPPSAVEAKPLPLAPDAWAAVLDFLGQSLRDAAQRECKVAEEMDDLRAKIVVAAARARLLLSYKNDLTKRVILEFAADKPVACGIEVSYIIPDAAWFPRYDVRADMAAGKIEVVSYGLVRQESGEDWSDVQLSFSAAEPSTAANLPELSSWRIAAAQPARVAQEAGIQDRAVLVAGRGGGGAFSQPNAPGMSVLRISGSPATAGYSVQVGQPATVLAADADMDALLDLRRSLQKVQAFASVPAAAQQGGGGGALGGSEAPSQADLLQSQVGEIERLNAKQQEARAKKDWQTFYSSNSLINDRIGKLALADQKSLESLQENVNANLDMAQRWLESQKLENGLIAPVASSGGYDYRWQALRRESVPSDGALTKAVLLRQEFPAEFVYEIAAQKSKMAFLRTKLANSTRSPFLAGPVSVFLGSDFVGESSLRTTAPSEEFTIGLGADEEIAVERRVETKRDTRGLLTSDYRFSVATTVTVRNGKSRPVTVAVLERMPVTWDSKLTISDGQFEPKPTATEQHQDRTTFVRWQMDLPPGAKQEIKMSYYYQHAADLRMVPTEDPSVKW